MPGGQAGGDAASAVAGVLGRRGGRDDVRGYVAEHLGDPGGMLVVDETSAAAALLKQALIRRSPSVACSAQNNQIWLRRTLTQHEPFARQIEPYRRKCAPRTR